VGLAIWLQAMAALTVALLLVVVLGAAMQPSRTKPWATAEAQPAAGRG
jgi:hypothetical protein